jgi:hypothetical protein
MSRPTSRALTTGGIAAVLLMWAMHAGQVRADGAAMPVAAAPAPLAVSAGDDTTGPRAQEPRARKDNLHIGGVIGAGFPRPLAIEGTVKVQRLVSIGVEYSLMPELTIQGVHTRFWAVAADMRVFPARNGFFVGLRAGRQHLAADTVLSIQGQEVPIDAAVETTFINPRAGILWTWNSGITLGIDAGLQIPVSARATGALVYADQVMVPQGMEIVDQVRSVADYLGRSVIPTFDLLRVGILL